MGDTLRVPTDTRGSRRVLSGVRWITCSNPYWGGTEARADIRASARRPWFAAQAGEAGGW